MTSSRDPVAQWRAVAVVLVSVLSAAAAHAAAGGGVPGPGGWAVVLLCLIPVAALAAGRPGRGVPGLMAAGLLGQAVGHVALSVVAPASGHPSPAVTGPEYGQGLGHAHAQVHGAVLTDTAGSGWGVVTESLAHLAHMEPAMLVAHLLGAALTAGLVGAVSEGLRRVAVRLIRLVRVLLAPQTPFPGVSANSRGSELAPVTLLTARTLRGPPRRA